MADAYDIMSMAKRSGAQINLQEDLQRYEDQMRAYQQKQGKKSFWGGLAQMAISPALNVLMPGGGFSDLNFLNPDNPDEKLQIKRDVVYTWRALIL